MRGLQQKQLHEHTRAFRTLLAEVLVIPLDQSSADLGGRIAGDLDRIGLTIGLADPLIAAIAVTTGRTLVTGNTRHYQRIVELGYDLKLEDWRDNP